MASPSISVVGFNAPSRNLLPDADDSAVHGRMVDHTSAAQVISDNAPARATGTVTVTGAGAQNDVVTVTIMGVAVDATVPATPTTTTVADAIREAINAKAALFGKVTATSSAAIVTITADVPGLGGNTYTLAVAVTGTVTATAGATKLAGGTKTITPLENFAIVNGRTIIQLRANRPIVATQAMVDAIAASGRSYQ